MPSVLDVLLESVERRLSQIETEISLIDSQITAVLSFRWVSADDRASFLSRRDYLAIIHSF
jgi:hypothetical protein